MDVHVSECELEHARINENKENENDAVIEAELNGPQSGGTDGQSEQEKATERPFGAMLLMFALIALILAAGCGIQFFTARYTAIKAGYENALASAEAALAAAEEERAEADSESAAHSEQRRKLTEQMLGAARSEIEILRQRDEAAEAAIAEAERTIEELQSAEDFAYYKAIYDEYSEGRAYVEEILSGD